MSLFKTGAGLAALAIAGAAYLAPAPEGPFGDGEPDKPSLHEQYELLRAGMDTGCVIGKGERLGDDKAQLVLGHGCTESFADYADVRYWADQPDGSVVFVAADGTVALRFGLGDGTAYEAFGDGAPLFALTDASY